jgi:hypothetical protein
MINGANIYRRWLMYIERIKRFRREIHEMNRRGYTVGIHAWRYFSRWQASLRNSRTPIKDASPWMTFDAIKWLDSVLCPEMRIFEYGSGGSSLFFSRRVREVVSAEHNPHWFECISRVMLEQKCSNWKGILAPPEREEGSDNREPSDPFGYVSSDEEFRGFSFKRYVNSIHEYPTGNFDLIVVDGRARPSCIAASLNKSKKWILIDNTERSYYLENFELGLLGNVTHFSGPAPYIEGFIRTSVIELTPAASGPLLRSNSRNPLAALRCARNLQRWIWHHGRPRPEVASNSPPWRLQ